MRGTADGLHVEAVRATVAGAGCALLEWTLFAACNVGLGLSFLLATLIAASTSILVNYVVSVRWVFAYRAIAQRRLELELFMLIGLTGLIVNLAMMALCVERMGLAPLPAKVVASLAVAIWAFTNKKVWLFAHRRARARGARAAAGDLPSGESDSP